MHPIPRALLAALATLAMLGAQSPQFLVVPAAYQSADAVGQAAIAGANNPLRQLTLIGASHLQSLVGRDLVALELRRTVANEAYLGGTANISLSLSTTPNQPLSADRVFQANVGPNAAIVWAGPTTLPSSPAITGATASWTANNVVRIAFQTPFTYTGGTLCVDLVGLPIPGQTTDWWMADAEFENLFGSVVSVGNGCGQFGGAQGAWSYVDKYTLLPGAQANFWAHGTPNGLGIAVFGGASPTPIPLSTFGLQAPGCNMHVQPGLVLATLVSLFVPEVHPQLQSRGGTADVYVAIPNSTWLFGFTLTTQWLDISQLATSEALQWSIATAAPALDMAVLEGDASESAGTLCVHRAHVMRFEYR